MRQICKLVVAIVLGSPGSQKAPTPGRQRRTAPTPVSSDPFVID
jgi:hypothetical protein